MSEQPRLRSVGCLRAEGFRRMVYWEWGNPHNKNVVLCVHGLTRNGRDFDPLAGALAERYRVLCPDVLGRGQSDWLDDPAGYSYAHYVSDLTTLIARSGAERVDWIGTSMGGLIGMMLAASRNSPLARLVLNDVGAFIPQAAVERLQTYVGKDPSFPDLAEAERYVRTTHAEFGALTDGQWAHLTRHGMRRRDDGRYSPAYDPAIAQVLTAQPPQDVAMWPIWEAVTCPVLVLRGAASKLLLPETVAEMRTRGPGCTVAEIAGAGHAPALMDDGQVRTVMEWLK